MKNPDAAKERCPQKLDQLWTTKIPITTNRLVFESSNFFPDTKHFCFAAAFGDYISTKAIITAENAFKLFSCNPSSLQ